MRVNVYVNVNKQINKYKFRLYIYNENYVYVCREFQIQFLFTSLQTVCEFHLSESTQDLQCSSSFPPTPTQSAHGTDEKK